MVISLGLRRCIWVGVLGASASCAALAGIDAPPGEQGDAGADATLDGPLGADREAGTEAETGQPLPASCAAAHAAGAETDGTYTIDLDGPGPSLPFAVYCRNMATVEPTEYLELPANVEAGLPGSNVSGFVLDAPAGVCTTTPTETVSFYRVRLDIQTLHVVTTDTAFAYVEGDAGPNLWPYGYAGSCVNGGDMSGHGNVDLTGTPFHMAPGTVFVPQGYEPGGSSTFSPDRKRVDLTGGGYGGWESVAPDAGGIGLEFDLTDD